MKTKFFSVVLFLLALSILTSCKEKPKEEKESTPTELIAETIHQCPMDCEDGKTYAEPGSCPVCKMDLKPLSKDTAMTCAVHKDGNCSCDGDTCACDNCAAHGKTMTCKVHEDGNCKCEGDKCACANCEEHA